MAPKEGGLGPKDPGRQALWDTGLREGMPPNISLVV